MSCAPPRPARSRRQRAFTLIELLVVLAILALLLTVATPRYVHHVERAREATLRSSLKVMREAIDKFAGDQGRLPTGLEELVARNYLKSVPVDPITEKSNTWVALTESELASIASAERTTPARPDPGLADVHSGASGNGTDGTPYESW